MSDVSKLIAQYREQRGSMGEKQKAEAERRLWEAHCVSSGAGNHGYRRDWFAKVLDGSAGAYEHRQMMLNAGPWVDPLWDMLDKGAAHYVVVRLFRQAREVAAKEQIAHERAVRRVIDEYNAAGVVAHSQDGKVFRRMTPTEKARSIPPPSDHEPDSDFGSLGTQNARSKKFLIQLSVLTDSYLKSCVEGPDDDTQLALRMASEEFVSFVREAAEDFKRRVNAVRSMVRKESRRQKVSREQFRQACEVLNLPYAYGQKIDLRFCKKTMLKRAAPLHPDRNNGSHSARAEYQAVVESYQVLEQYAEGMKLNEDGERSHENR